MSFLPNDYSKRKKNLDTLNYGGYSPKEEDKKEEFDQDEFGNPFEDIYDDKGQIMPF